MKDRSFSYRKPRASMVKMGTVSAVLTVFLLWGAISAWSNPLRRIVEFEDETPAERQEEIIEDSGSTLVRLLPLIDSASIVLPEVDPEAALASLTAATEVIAVHADAVLNAQSTSSSEGIESPTIEVVGPPPSGWSWNQDKIEQDLLDIELPGDGVHVAVVDTGIDASHPALAGRVEDGYNAVTATGAETAGCGAEGAASEGAESEGAESEGAESEGAESEGAESEGAESEGAESEGAESEGAESEGAESEGAESEGAESEGAESEGAESEGAENAIIAQTDCNGHGTHVAGIIAADTVGIAPYVKLYSVRVLNRHGGGFVSDLIDGLSWIYGHPEIRVVNMSLGFYKTGTYPLLRRVVQLLKDSGVTLVAAIGNYSSDCMVGSGADRHVEIDADGCNTRIKFPARYRETIGVAASNDDDGITHYSIHGPEVDLTAPGGTSSAPVVSTHSDIVANSYNSSTSAEGAESEGAESEGAESEGAESEGAESEGAESEGAESEGAESEGAETGAYGASSGTSMAAPHVAGLVALLLQANENLSPDDIQAILQSTAYILPGVPRSAQGAGRIDADAAVAAAADWSAADTDAYAASAGNNLSIEESFIVEDNVDIDNSDYIHVHNHVQLNTNVTLGEGVSLSNHVTLGTNVAIGHGTDIGNKTKIGHTGADMYGVTIGDESSIGKHTTVGSNVLIGHDTDVGMQVTIGNHVTIGDDVEIGKKAEICDGAVIADHTVIASKAEVGCP